MSRRKHHGVSDQRKASIHRWQDAVALFEKKRWRGAMCLAGYAVECRLKYKLMQQWDCLHLEALEKRLQSRGELQSPFSHSLRLLLRMAGGVDRLRRRSDLWFKFANTLNHWQSAWRYNPDLSNEKDAEEFMEAASEMIAWIDNNL